MQTWKSISEHRSYLRRIESQNLQQKINRDGKEGQSGGLLGQAKL